MQFPQLSWPWVGIIASVILGGLAFYYIQYTFADEEKQRVELALCLERAEQTYSESWDNKCYELDKLPGCGLDDFYAHDFNENKKEHKDDCFRYYGR